jgi:TolA-binding protein
MNPLWNSRSLPALACALLIGGCAAAAEVTGTATQEDLMQLRADVTQLQLALQRVRAETEKQTGAVTTRLGEQATQSQRQAEDMTRRLEALSSSVTSLSSRVDELSARLDSGARRSTPAPPSPQRPTTSAPAPSVPGPGAPATAARPPAPASGLQPQDVYQAAYIDFSKGSYALAVAGFREFLRRYPDHELADNSQYWIGEAHFSISRGHANSGQADKAKEELERAVQEFRKVIANYPRGDKAPTALYKEALALLELKQPGVAQARLQYLVDNFPQAEETPLARERLAALKTGG